MAIALNNADNNATFNWCNNGYGNYWSVQANTHMAASVDDALTSSATSGLDETWDPSYTTNAFTMSGFSGVKAYNSTFPAFNAAASYNTWYTGSQPLKWYLPSISDLKWVFSSLSFLNQSTISTSHPNYYYARQVNEAFTQVGGTPLWSETESNGTSYITSTEINQYYYGYVKFLDRNTFWGNSLKSSFGDLRVRPFVAY